MGTLVLVLSSGKQALDAVRLERRRMVAERVMLIEREEVAGRDDYPTDSALQKWAHDAGVALDRRPEGQGDTPAPQACGA